MLLNRMVGSRYLSMDRCVDYGATVSVTVTSFGPLHNRHFKINLQLFPKALFLFLA